MVLGKNNVGNVSGSNLTWKVPSTPSGKNVGPSHGSPSVADSGANSNKVDRFTGLSSEVTFQKVPQGHNPLAGLKPHDPKAVMDFLKAHEKLTPQQMKHLVIALHRDGGESLANLIASSQGAERRYLQKLTSEMEPLARELSGLRGEMHGPFLPVYAHKGLSGYTGFVKSMKMMGFIDTMGQKLEDTQLTVRIPGGKKAPEGLQDEMYRLTEALVEVGILPEGVAAKKTIIKGGVVRTFKTISKRCMSTPVQNNKNG